MVWNYLEELFLEGKGSFRGHEFFVKAADRTAGRRTVTHEFPGRDKPMIEDLGMAAGGDTLDAFVIGDDYMREKILLWNAFNEPGPGPLIHPFWGDMTVTVVGKVRIRETPNEGGMARFTLTVVEGGEDRAPTVVPDTVAAVEEFSDLCNAALSADFNTDFDVIGYIANVLQAAINLVNAIASDLNKIKGYVNAAMNIVDAIGDAIQSFADAAASLILAPAELAAALQGILQDIMTAASTITDAWDSYFTSDEYPNATAGSPSTAATGSSPATGDERVKLAMKAFRDATAFGDDIASVNETTAQRTREADNQAAMIALMRGMSTVESCRAAATIPFASYDQALEVRDELADELDNLMSTASDESYAALFDLRVAIVTHMTDASADLPRVIEYTPAKNLPALVIAHDLYGDASRDTDVIDRNGIRNPCIVPGMVELEVLSDA